MAMTLTKRETLATTTYFSTGKYNVEAGTHLAVGKYNQSVVVAELDEIVPEGKNWEVSVSVNVIETNA